MHINKFLARAADISRRAADTAVAEGRVLVNGQPASTGQTIKAGDTVTYNDSDYRATDFDATSTVTIMLHKPVGYVVSRNGQGSRTVYDLLPAQYQSLQPVGRLDKDSSGLLLLTNDGELANQLTHPRYRKTKIYEVTLDAALAPLHRQMISEHGLQLEDGLSRLQLDRLAEGDDRRWMITMHEGRNRQIRRTFAALGYDVIRLHRIQFGNYLLGELAAGSIQAVSS